MEETRNGAATKYSYDAAGNRLSKEDCEGVTEYHYNEKNQLILLESPSGKKQFTYSRQGSILTEEGAEGTRRYVYNSRNQQIRVEWKRGIQENRYDAEGLRYETEENGQRFRFVYHNGELLYEGGDREETSYHIGAGIEGFKRNGERFYYHQDEQLSNALITDGTGRIRNHYLYDAFGNGTASQEEISNRLCYTGQQYDQATEQYYLRARYYNPILGRFMQEDEYLGDGLNLYAYCENNPVTYYDPSGYSSYEAKVGSGIGDEGGSKSGSSSEVFYRTMSQADYDYLRMTGELPATSETFISPTYSFSSNYDGVTVEFELRNGTTNSLLEIGVGNNADQAIRDYGVLPQVSKGWTENNAFFKGEGTQTNIGLGQGKALEIFNSNIINFTQAGGK